MAKSKLTVPRSRDPEMHEWLFFFTNNVMITARVVEIKERAIKVHYALEGVSPGATPGPAIFRNAAWIPLSVIIDDPKCKRLPKDGKSLTVKKWFTQKFEMAHHIEAYYIDKDGNEMPT